MKFTCNRKAFSDSFQLVCNVIEPKVSKPVLRNVRMEAKEGALSLAATDLTTGASTNLKDVVVEKPGTILVPGEDVNNILREMRDETVVCLVEGTMCHIEGSESDFKVPTENPEDFPEFPGFPGKPMLEIQRNDLDVMIRRTSFAVSAEQMRYALNGILFVLGKGSLEMVATDGRRLAHTKRAAKSERATKGHIVPIKAVNELQKMLVDGLETVAMSFDDRRMYARAGEASMFAQLVEGQFPSYNEVIPKDNELKIHLTADDLAVAVAQAALVTTPSSMSVQFHFEDNAVRLSARSSEHGEAKVEIKLKYSEAPLDISFNPALLLDMLRAVAGHETVMEIKDGESSVIFRCGDDYVYVVMPISMRQE